MNVVSMRAEAVSSPRGAVAPFVGESKDEKAPSMRVTEADTKFLRGILAALILSTLMTGMAAAYAVAQVS